MTTNKEEYIEKMARDLREWSADIDEFERIASRASTERLPDYEQSMRNLREKLDLLSTKMQELRGSSGEAWTTLETGVETVKHELRDAFESARDTVRKAA
jgi:predicted nuclease with TOPRIM domain